MCTIYNNQTSDNTQAGSSGYFSRVYLMQGVTRSPAEDFYGVCFDLLFNIRFYSFIAPQQHQTDVLYMTWPYCALIIFHTETVCTFFYLLYVIVR